MLSRVALVVVILGCAGAVGWTLWRQSHPTDTGGCEPEGGLRCGANGIEVCTAGALTAGVPCTGGCKDGDGVARCQTEAGNLTAPIGAWCQPGMTVCSHDATTLLVCRGGRLALGATCAKGCVDQGEGKAIFCLDENDGIRFADGFPCPGFSPTFPDGRERACGADGVQLLVCQEGLLVPDASARCKRCAESRTGQVACEAETGETGETPPG